LGSKGLSLHLWLLCFTWQALFQMILILSVAKVIWFLTISISIQENFKISVFKIIIILIWLDRFISKKIKLNLVILINEMKIKRSLILRAMNAFHNSNNIWSSFLALLWEILNKKITIRCILLNRRLALSELIIHSFMSKELAFFLYVFFITSYFNLF